MSISIIEMDNTSSGENLANVATPIKSKLVQNSVRNRSPLILQSLEPDILPVKTLSQEFQSLIFTDDAATHNNRHKSVLLLDDNERLLIESEEEFLQLLQVAVGTKVKVVSIFGNTGEGKSYTLNEAFFDGKPIFQTSASQWSCTMGAWAYYNPLLGIICLDTEGLLGVSQKENRRTRLLLKILAVSDVVIFRTKAERLTRDMYTFLGGASEAYKKYFSSALQQCLQRHGIDKATSGLGPALIIFHETRYTNPLHMSSVHRSSSAEHLVRKTFDEMHLPYDGFSSIKYLGYQNNPQELNNSISYQELKELVLRELGSTEVRSPRDAKYVYLTLKGLNDKFYCYIQENIPQLYLPAYFTCQDKCLSCGRGCSLSLGHKDDNESHKNDSHCTLQHQYHNYIYLCKKCYNNGIKQVVEPSDQLNSYVWSSLTSVWSGYHIDCPKCGRIYQSREHWYGNKDPKDDAVVVEIIHVWPDSKEYFQERSMLGSHNSAQKVLDSVASISSVVSSVGSQPTKLISDWVTDQIAPTYWRPNSEITECFLCHVSLEGGDALKHHCRSCGEGFCATCSSNTMLVPERGWADVCVRVCDNCYNERKNKTASKRPNMDKATTTSKPTKVAPPPTPPPLLPSPPKITASNSCVQENEVRARRIGESLISSLSAMKSVVLDLPRDFIKDSVRPTYWVPDSECKQCVVCQRSFNEMLRLHHCRDCGCGVCDNCSTSRKSVPLRGWDYPTRVCDNCLT